MTSSAFQHKAVQEPGIHLLVFLLLNPEVGREVIERAMAVPYTRAAEYCFHDVALGDWNRLAQGLTSRKQAGERRSQSTSRAMRVL